MATSSSSSAQQAPQTVQIQPCRYKTGKTLGAGSYSVVKECVHIDTGRFYAAKVINKRLMAGREHMVRNEIAVLKRVSMGHRHILTLVDYFETTNNLYLVTDLALGGELFDRICRKGSYYESDAAALIRSTLSAVAYLHDHNIVHRDLKPENLLFRTPDDNADLLIADFGLSRIIDEEQFHVLTTTCGTPGYMAPEIFRKSGHGKPVDLWAIGVITYFLLCGYTPFDRESNLEEMQAILSADYSFSPEQYWRGISDNARHFIQRCLTVDQKKRITAHEALSHQWIMTDTHLGPDGQDLLPTVKRNFNARGKLHVAIDTIRAINQLRSAGLRQAANAQKAKAAGGGDTGAAGAGAAAAGGGTGPAVTAGHAGHAGEVHSNQNAAKHQGHHPADYQQPQCHNPHHHHYHQQHCPYHQQNLHQGQPQLPADSQTPLNQQYQSSAGCPHPRLVAARAPPPPPSSHPHHPPSSAPVPAMVITTATESSTRNNLDGINTGANPSSGPSVLSSPFPFNNSPLPLTPWSTAHSRDSAVANLGAGTSQQHQQHQQQQQTKMLHHSQHQHRTRPTHQQQQSSQPKTSPGLWMKR